MNTISEEIWDQKYRFKKADGTPIDVTVEDTWRRVAKALAAAEKTPSDWEDVFYWALQDYRFTPGGRITAGAGTGRSVTLFNCFVMGTIPDSMGGIFDMLKEASLTMQQGGGIGYDFSTIRPKGAPVLGVDSDASGPLSFMDVWDAMCRTIMSAGSRRGAMMATMRCDHPDIEDFISAKRDPNRLRMFNLSVLVTDAFMDAVERNEDWPLVFEGKVLKTIKARTLWERIMLSTYAYAEPGVIFIDRVNEMNNLNYCETISCTNPCFTGDQSILTDQGPKTFSELEGKRVSVLTENQEGKLIYRPMDVFKTAQDQEILSITLDDGTIIKCTPTHEFFDLERNRIEARDLTPGQRLASVYRHNANSKGYKRLTNGIDNPLEHHIPFETIPEGFHVHHKNEVKDDNRPENLELIHGSDHNSYHMKGDKNPSVTHPDNNWLIQQDHSGKNNGRYRDDLNDDDLQEMRKNGMSYKAIANAVGCSKYTAMKRLGYERPNHKVVSVELLSERQDVFCGTVEETHRFFLSCERGGVLVSNCGEQPLPPYGNCLLGSINLSAFYSKGKFDKGAMKMTVRVATRMLDNVIDVSRFPLEKQELEAKNKRRIGLGITGLGDVLALLGLRYGSKEAVDWTEDILKTINEEAYKTSISLAAEKGPFPLYCDEYLNSKFLEVLSTETVNDLGRYGIRNALLTSIAPTGTISLYAGNVSGGIEPIFALQYERKVLQKDGTHTKQVVKNWSVSKWEEENPGAPLPDSFVTAQTLKPEDHVSMQAVAQKYIDSSISKTVNVPETISFQDFTDVYLSAYNSGCKGCTTYRPNDVTGSVLTVKEDDGEGGTCRIDPETGQKECS